MKGVGTKVLCGNPFRWYGAETELLWGNRLSWRGVETRSVVSWFGGKCQDEWSDKFETRGVGLEQGGCQAIKAMASSTYG